MKNWMLRELIERGDKDGLRAPRRNRPSWPRRRLLPCPPGNDAGHLSDALYIACRRNR